MRGAAADRTRPVVHWAWTHVKVAALSPACFKYRSGGRGPGPGHQR